MGEGVRDERGSEGWEREWEGRGGERVWPGMMEGETVVGTHINDEHQLVFIVSVPPGHF